MTKPAATRSLVVEREMPHPPEKIWRALTQGPLIEEWLMKNDFQPIVGHRFNFRAPPMAHWNGVTDCEVLVVEPNQRLSYSWNASGELISELGAACLCRVRCLRGRKPPHMTRRPDPTTSNQSR
jgi:uncharacterized protein YndB with AHSA1/START domain